jgi:hypothetical protein
VRGLGRGMNIDQLSGGQGAQELNGLLGSVGSARRSWEYLGNQTPGIPKTTSHGKDPRYPLSCPNVTDCHEVD